MSVMETTPNPPVFSIVRVYIGKFILNLLYIPILPGDNKFTGGIKEFCDFPLSKTPLYRYTYRNICRENRERLEDGCATIFLSTCVESEADVPKALVDFFWYIENFHRN